MNSYCFFIDSVSGCQDGSTEGLELHSDIHACSGKWAGHVRKGRVLCSKGWKVCSPREENAIATLTWTDVFQVTGCYAYNADSHKGGCSRSVTCLKTLFTNKIKVHVYVLEK